MDMPTERTVRSWRHIAVAAIGGIVIWAGPAILLKHPGAFGLAVEPRLLLRVLAASLGMTWTVVFATLAYRAQDEFTQEASKFAWYWGGALGAAMSAPIYVFVAQGGLELIGAGPPAAERHTAFLAFSAGYQLLGVSLMAGFAVARVWWSVSKR
jgi:hypothetical protein